MVARFKLALVALAALLAASAAPAYAAQPSSDLLRIAQDGVGKPYEVWVDWSPEVVTTPDGGAWAFFSAQIDNGDGTFGTKKLYASRFDPAIAAWQPATSMPGGQIQFGATAVVDGQGTVHLVYTDRADDQPTSFGTLVYTKSTPEGGWTAPVPVAPNPAAGHQLSPELVIDGNGGLHLAWQDQRAVDEAARTAQASNADVFSSDLGADGVWTQATQIDPRPDATTNASRPQLAVDGNRLVAIWSVYTAASGLTTADRLEWSTRPLDGSAGWSSPAVALQRGDAQIGGRLLDLASDPTGGVQLVYGVSSAAVSRFFVAKLGAGTNEWSAAVEIMNGDRGAYPSAVVGNDGTLYVAYNLGSGMTVQVGITGYQPGQPRGTVETVATAGESGAQGRAAITLDANGRLWLVYMHQPANGSVNEVRAIRGVSVALDLAPETPPATPVPAATPAG